MNNSETLDYPVPVGRWRRILGLAAVVGGVFIAVLAIQAPSEGAFRIPILLQKIWGGPHPFVQLLWGAVSVGLVLVSLLLWGKLSDVYGRRRLWLVGLLLFMVGSIGRGTINEIFPAQFHLAGLVTSLGTAAVVVLGPALIGDLYPPSERAKWHGVLAAAFGLGLFGEPTVRHALSQLAPAIETAGDAVLPGVGGVRPWPLYVNLIVGAVVVLAGCFGLPSARSGSRTPVRLREIGALVGAGVLFFVPLQFAWPRHDEWTGILESSQIYLAGGACMLVVLALSLPRAPNPIFNLRLLTSRTHLIAIFLGFVVSVALTNAQHLAWFFNPDVSGSPTDDANPLRYPEQVAAGVAMAVSAVAAGRIVGRTGRDKRPILALLLFGIVGAVLLSRLTVEATAAELALGLAMTGLGLGGMVALLIAVVQDIVPRRGLGEATAGLWFFGALGAAVLAPFLPWPARGTMRDSLGRSPETLPDFWNYIIAEPETLGVVSLVTALLMVVGLVLVRWLPETSMRATLDPDSPHPSDLGQLKRPKATPPPRDIPRIAERRRARGAQQGTTNLAADGDGRAEPPNGIEPPPAT